MSRVIEIKALGKTWKISTRVEQGDVDDFLDWVKEQEGDPFEGLKEYLPLMPENERAKLFREARDKRDMLKCLHWESPLAENYKKTIKGALKAFMMGLKRFHPEVTEKEAFDIMQEIDPDEADKLLKAIEATNRSKLKNSGAPEKERGQ